MENQIIYIKIGLFSQIITEICLRLRKLDKILQSKQIKIEAESVYLYSQNPILLNGTR